MSVSTCLNRLSKSSFTKSLFDCCFVILTTISVVTYELIMSFDIVISNLCVSILFREIETDIPCPIKITGATGVLIRIGWTFDEVVNHSLNVWLHKWSNLEVSNNLSENLRDLYDFRFLIIKLMKIITSPETFFPDICVFFTLIKELKEILI